MSSGAGTGKLDCAETAAHYRELVRRNVRELPEAPGLAILLGSEDPGSVLYRNLLVKDCEDLGIQAHHHVVDGGMQMVKTIARFNQDAKTHGIFIFYPLNYGELRDDEIMDLVDPGKDIEGLHSINIGYLTKFRKRVDAGADRRAMVPCTGRAVLKVIKRGFGDDYLTGKTVLIINDSLRIGRPLSAMSANLKATPILCHQHTDKAHLETFVKLADVIVSAVPVKGYRLPTEWIKDETLCIDLSHEGNFDFDALIARGIAHTNTTRNSVGKVTRAMALLNLTYAAGWESGR
ncbi:MAG: bifunctional 5,10-methylenetetrahydrofolate dehydrogenase/5,10-methenyltetrahydrofolate cyclohydrolase [Firmicutes bacterium]|nr:bifunctional 5,10-methylenetetrahydrofolate dehydrogenase/5,10-methenyltetrahydrofolate cyclohydrolase [Bacillota bacterium]